MSNFSQRVADLTTAGYTVIEVTQQVPGTAWQKTAHRIQQQVAQGNYRIAVVTNINNPLGAELESSIADARRAMPATEIAFFKETM